MKLEHYSANVITTLYNVYQNDDLCDKPQGLWLSIPGENDWPTWCIDEEFRIGSLRYRYDFQLRPNANILLINTAEELVSFSNQYKKVEGWCSINWKEVADSYDGIMICDYFPILRYDPNLLWYNTWDCTSGCVWNTDVLKLVGFEDLLKSATADKIYDQNNLQLILSAFYSGETTS